MDIAEFYSANYSTARERFRVAAAHAGWTLESYPIGQPGPDGQELTIDAALSLGGAADRTMIVSSGLHGVEGYFGSAVQIAMLQEWAKTRSPVDSPRFVCLHGLNPHGFAWGRRCDDKNVDPNRNFLLPGELYRGSPPGYAELDPLLNPPRPPSRAEAFTLRALCAVVRHGMPALRQSIAAGQYDFPKGLFYGGSAPSQTHRVLAENLGRWLAESRRVVHLDFHTGLGPWASSKLLIDYVLSDAQRDWLARWLGPGSYEACDSSGISYDARGGFGRWCVTRYPKIDYLFACAEFGTYRPLQMLAGLRAENQAHHFCPPESPIAVRARARLRELFCPASMNWRKQVWQSSANMVHRAVAGLMEA